MYPKFIGPIGRKLRVLFETLLKKCFVGLRPAKGFQTFYLFVTDSVLLVTGNLSFLAGNFQDNSGEYSEVSKSDLLLTGLFWFFMSASPKMNKASSFQQDKGRRIRLHQALNRFNKCKIAETLCPQKLNPHDIVSWWKRNYPRAALKLTDHHRWALISSHDVSPIPFGTVRNLSCSCKTSHLLVMAPWADSFNESGRGWITTILFSREANNQSIIRELIPLSPKP